MNVWLPAAVLSFAILAVAGVRGILVLTRSIGATAANAANA